MPVALDNISFVFPGTEKYVFKDLNLKIDKPGFHALFGPSGVGKTSLAKLIIGALTGYSGSLETDGNGRLLYSYNLERLPGWSSVGAHLDKMMRREQKSHKNELIDIFGLDQCIDSRFSKLSLGQQNRINLIRYLLQDFTLLIMDESLANVDELTRGRIILTIKERYPQAYFLYISHNIIEVAKYCDQIYVLRGVAKMPQINTVQGYDLKDLSENTPEPDQAALDRIMLEIMNVS